MASMEQLNEFERSASKNQWGIDKRIPVALIFVVVLQTLGFTWGAAVLSSDVKNNGKSIEKLEAKVEKIASKLEVQVTTLQPKSDTLREFARIDGEIDDLEGRLLDIERTQFSKDMWDNSRK